MSWIDTVADRCVEFRDGLGRIAAYHAFGECSQAGFIGGTEHRVDFGHRDMFATEAEHLFEERLAISHGTGGTPCDEFEGVLVGLSSFAGADEFQAV